MRPAEGPRARSARGSWRTFPWSAAWATGVYRPFALAGDPGAWILHWLWLVALTVASSRRGAELSPAAWPFPIADIFTFSAVLLFGPAVGTRP